MKELKQAILIRKDIDISEGKKIVQGSHASLGAYQHADQETFEAWNSQGQKKIVLKVSKQELKDKMKKAQETNVPCFQVKDAGHTEVEPGTLTALGLGPAKESKLDKITSDLPLLK